ncbi:luxQ [Symbiodinium sp. CCMP2592]|nr:luxQ [Symbiodinium sp. CCMP2592]
MVATLWAILVQLHPTSAAAAYMSGQCLQFMKSVPKALVGMLAFMAATAGPSFVRLALQRPGRLFCPRVRLGRRAQGGNKASAVLANWLGDEAALRAWTEHRREEIIPQLASWSLVRVRDFVPQPVAEEALRIAEELAEEDWRQTAPVEADDAVHRFRYRGLNETGEAFNALQKALEGLIPAIRSAPTRAEFRFGRYGPSDFIDTHTDEGTYAAFVDDPSLYSRRIALIWYLTKNWTCADGGVFIDDEPDCVGGGAEVVPRFNEAVCFLVPRCHRVSPVVATDRFRYSLYGWWYTRGEYIPPWQRASVRAAKLLSFG